MFKCPLLRLFFGPIPSANRCAAIPLAKNSARKTSREWHFEQIVAALVRKQ
jgi:hypothetical protein